MPVTKPSTSDLNFTPRAIALESPPSAVAGAAKSNSVARGTTASEALDSGPVATAFVALTVNVYGEPFVSPGTVAVVADAPAVTGVCAVAPMYGVIVKPVSGLPLSAGGVQVTRPDPPAGC